jgi:galactose-1-phosphate uridylyltransferase
VEVTVTGKYFPSVRPYNKLYVFNAEISHTAIEQVLINFDSQKKKKLQQLLAVIVAATNTMVICLCRADNYY